MGTRGVFGVRCDEQDRMMYNHFDSYPECLGDGILRSIKSAIAKDGRSVCVARWREQARKVRLVNERDKPTPADKLQCRMLGLVDTGVGGQSDDDWYCLTRGGQGELLLMLASGVMLDAGKFILDSLFCEWGYLLNLDAEAIEVYRGFQDKPHNLGRYAGDMSEVEATKRDNAARRKRGEPPMSIYYPCALIATLPLADIDQHASLTAFLQSVGAIEEDAAAAE